MPIQYANHPKQPGETLRYSMTYTPGSAIALGDTLKETPTVTVKRLSDGVDVTSDVVGPPAIVGMLVVNSVALVANTVYCSIKGGTSGETYKVTFKADTNLGEVDVEEDLVLAVTEL